MSFPGLRINNFHFSVRLPQGQQHVEQPELASEPPPAPVVALTGAPDEREVLIKLAEERAIKIDLRWKTDRIRAVLEHS